MKSPHRNHTYFIFLISIEYFCNFFSVVVHCVHNYIVRISSVPAKCKDILWNMLLSCFSEIDNSRIFYYFHSFPSNICNVCCGVDLCLLSWNTLIFYRYCTRHLEPMLNKCAGNFNDLALGFFSFVYYFSAS